MLRNSTFYEILGVSTDADFQLIKIAYKTKAREIHPDKNRDDPEATSKFQKLNEAYLVLKDPKKREDYDQLISHKNSNNFFEDCFFCPTAKPTKRTDNIEKILHVSLEDFYLGGDIILEYERTIKCPDCTGKYPNICPACNGSGQCSLFGRMITRCHICNGSGFYFEYSDRCGGNRTIRTSAKIEVHIEPGMENGDRITIQGASNEEQDLIAGDLVVLLEMKENEKFTRKNNDLLYRKKISLSEALLGTKFIIDHMDGRKLLLTTNSVIAPGMVKMVENEGMPLRGKRFKKGRLFVEFNVEFPSYVPDDLKDIIESTFPPLNSLAEICTNDENVFFVEAKDEENQNKNSEAGKTNNAESETKKDPSSSEENDNNVGKGDESQQSTKYSYCNIM